MFKKILILIGTFLLISNVDAEVVNDFNVIASNTKFYKTIIYNNEVMLNNINNSNSITTEISEDEYNNANDFFEKNNFVETNYKKLTSSIIKNGKKYRFKAELTWKNIPKIRSNDIIGIGYENIVKISGRTYFVQSYCLNNGKCYNSSVNSSQNFSNGVGTSFLIPTGDIKSLKQIFYFDVVKNTSSVINLLKVSADYSHATTAISLTNSKKFTVNLNGIKLNNSIKSYYDEINAATTTLNNISW